MPTNTFDRPIILDDPESCLSHPVYSGSRQEQDPDDKYIRYTSRYFSQEVLF